MAGSINIYYNRNLSLLALFFFGVAHCQTCQEQADAYCEPGCYDEISSRPCDGPMLARQSGPTPTEWRCYSPSTLDDNNETYVSGDCYCSRNSEIEGILDECSTANVTTVYASDMDGAPCYRIPTIVRSSITKTLFAFAEQRETGCSDDGSNNIVLRRSFDDGNTWESIQTIAKGNGAPYSNPNPAIIQFENNTEGILLHYDTMNNPSTTKCASSSFSSCLNMQIWSYDNGETWTNLKDITSYLPEEAQGCMPGPSVGIQSSNHNIYFSCHGVGPGVILYYSEDYGETWKYSDPVDGITNECTIALLKNESVAMNCRTGSIRAEMIFDSQGMLLTPPGIQYPPELIDPNCQGSMISIQPPSSSSDSDDVVLYLSNDNTTSSRKQITVKKSLDSGSSWDNGKLIWDGPSAYSQLVSWQNDDDVSTTLGLLFELGESSTYEAIGFVTWTADDE